MSTRQRVVVAGERRGRQQLQTALSDFHEARLAGSISQARIGLAINKSDAWISWTESGANESLSVIDLSRLLACVGLQLSLRAYPAGRGLRDEAQLRLLARFRSAIAPAWQWRTEVPLALPGDQRAWDAVISNRGCRIGVDAETRLHDAQAVDRRTMLKLRDSGLDRAIILLAPTRHNRSALREHAGLLSSNYPIGTRAALAALRAARDLGGNAVVVLPPERAVPGGADRDSSLIGIPDAGTPAGRST